ncbi:MAG: peptidylprolyl isomerase [Nanoarchaeota archaeon]
MLLQEHDFITLDFIGKVKETEEIFDITQESDAKRFHLYNPEKKYQPLTICIGERHVVEGLDEFFKGKELGKTYTVVIPAEKAFGKRNPKLLRLVPMHAFHEHKIRPEPGLHVNLDGMLATVRSVSGGRIILDFNHPLAGKDVEYTFTIHQRIDSSEEKLKCLITFLMPGLPYTFKGSELHVDIALPEQLQRILTEKITTLIPVITTVTFKKEELNKETSLEKKKTIPAPKV